MTFADERGCGVRAEGKIGTTNEVVERLRDMIIIRLDRKGLSVREVARVLNLPKSTVYDRLKAIPTEVAKHYGEGRLEWLDSA